MQKFLLIFGLMLVYFLFWFGVTAAGALAVEEVDEAIGVALVLFGIVGFLAALLPFMHWIAGRVYSFPGEGAPLSETAVRQRLLTIATQDVPVTIEKRGDKLVATWRYADARWWNVLSRSGMTKLYELHIRLNDARKTATLIDVHKSVSWRAGPEQVQLRAGFSRGVDLRYERVIGYGWDDAFQFGRVVDYRFKNNDIKNPVLNLLVESGWRVKFGLW